MKGRLPLVGLNIVPAESYRAAAGPLFAEGIVDALEWDVDDTFGFDSSEEWSLPPWVEAGSTSTPPTTRSTATPSGCRC